MNPSTLTSVQALEDSPLLPLGPVSERPPSAKSTHIARKSSRKTSTPFLRSLKVSDAEKGGRNNLPHQIEYGYTGTFGTLTDETFEEPLFSQEEFPVSLLLAPGSDEAKKMTAGSGRMLFDSLVKPSRLSLCLKTLLGYLLLKEDWSSRHCFLKWRASATKSARRLSFQLAASRPITTDTGSLLLPTLQARDHFPPHSLNYVKEKKEQGHGMANLGDVLSSMMPTLSARDWKSEKSNITDNARPLSEVVGRLMPSLRTNKRGAPDSHGNVTAWSGLKLTSSFCEAYQGFPIGWTEIDEPESMPSGTRSSRRRPIRSSKPSERP